MAAIDAFVDGLHLIKDAGSFTRNIVDVWGVRRTHPQFWDIFHDATDYLNARTPVEAGILDMSRYENL